MSGTDWLPEPWQSCERREIDFGGGRCQAFPSTMTRSPGQRRIAAISSPVAPGVRMGDVAQT